jgi:hypothetical protein
MKSRSSRTKRRAEPARAPRWPEALAADVVADSVVWEVSQFLRVKLPRERYVSWLTIRAVRCFQHDPAFRRKIRGAVCREWLYAFCRHWLSGLLRRERPDLWHCLPAGFSVGYPLPDGRYPRALRRAGPIARKPLRWNAARVLADPRWRAILAA